MIAHRRFSVRDRVAAGLLTVVLLHSGGCSAMIPSPTRHITPSVLPPAAAGQPGKSIKIYSYMTRDSTLEKSRDGGLWRVTAIGPDSLCFLPYGGGGELLGYHEWPESTLVFNLARADVLDMEERLVHPAVFDAIGVGLLVLGILAILAIPSEE